MIASRRELQERLFGSKGILCAPKSCHVGLPTIGIIQCLG